MMMVGLDHVGDGRICHVTRNEEQPGQVIENANQSHDKQSQVTTKFSQPSQETECRVFNHPFKPPRRVVTTSLRNREGQEKKEWSSLVKFSFIAYVSKMLV